MTLIQMTTHAVSSETPPMVHTRLPDRLGLPRIQGVILRLRKRIQIFLETIGPRRGQQVSREAQLARLRLYHAEFRRLISANHSFLQTVADLKEQRLTHHYVDPSWVKRNAIRVLSDIHAMVESINVLSGDRYLSLRPAFERVADALTDSLEDRSDPLSASPASALLEKAMSLISSLNLIDPDSIIFTPANCVTLHDLAILVHEKACREVVAMGDNVGDLKGVGYKLNAFPTALYVVDLGGGLKEIPNGSTLKRSQIASVPFSALLTGMFDEKLSRVDLPGFLSGTREEMFTRESMLEPVGEPRYAIVSDKYLNFSSGTPDHYSVLDSYCSETVNKNYIAFSFNGGATDRACVNQKAEALGKLLRSLHFSVDVRENRVRARFHQYERTAIEANLGTIGRMFTL